MPNEPKRVHAKVKTSLGDREFFDDSSAAEYADLKPHPAELDPHDWDYSDEYGGDPYQEDRYEEAVNEDFDRTYRVPREKVPLRKRWWFWVLLVLLIAGIAFYALLYFDVIGRIGGEETTIAAGTLNDSEEETSEEVLEAKDLLMPEGSEVKKGPDGQWGLYRDDELLTSYYGIASNQNGTWFINFGLVDFDFDGYVKVNGTTYSVTQGKVDISSPVMSDSRNETVTANVDEQPMNDAGLNSAGTPSQQDALAVAVDYINQIALSREFLIAEIEKDGYSHEDAVWAVDHCGANWNEMAYQKAVEYLKLTYFTESDMVSQLEFEGFTPEEAKYGAEKAGL